MKGKGRKKVENNLNEKIGRGREKGRGKEKPKRNVEASEVNQEIKVKGEELWCRKSYILKIGHWRGVTISSKL